MRESEKKRLDGEFHLLRSAERAAYALRIH